ncbi:MAG TPA: 50S ribosomal protein L9 [Dehalococcoidia bacterium]|jgi:large subunit ribosomal protein L9|nr:50S ribosomal protein L9 [Dehalococcoidia bacterium]
MKVVFLEDVPDVADAGEIKEVADGYARNFLIPKKLAVLADARAMHLVEAQLKKKARLQAEIEAEMRELAQQLEGKEIVLKTRAGAKGRLYGSITNADIAEELEKSAGVVVDKRKIELDEPIHEVGSYEITIRLTKDIIPKIKLSVVPEEKKKEKAEEKKEEEGTS